MLRDIKSMNQNIFLTVDTTCPLPRSDRPPTPKTPPRSFEPPPTIHEVSKPISVSGLYLGINLNWHELRKQEKCSSLVPPRGIFHKTRQFQASIVLCDDTCLNSATSNCG